MLRLFLVCISTLRTSCTAEFYTSALLDLTMLSLASVSFFPPPTHTITRISSPPQLYKLNWNQTGSCFYDKHQTLSLTSLPPHSGSITHWTIPSYPALAWENDKKNDKCPRKTAREMVWKWECVCGGGVTTGESGQAGRKEGERQRKGKEEAGVLNKQNKWKWVRCRIQRRKGGKKQQMDFWNINIFTLYYW